MLNETLNGNEHGKVTIEKVESCSNYTFSVRCALDKAPWSDWSQKIVLTTKLNSKSNVETACIHMTDKSRLLNHLCTNIVKISNIIIDVLDFMSSTCPVDDI